MARFHNLLLVALIIIRFSHKALRSNRGAENSTGLKLPDFTLIPVLPFLNNPKVLARYLD